ncbi:MAG TPA: GNAT family N-acetyltransferase [Hyphomicrobiaceae bacterium]|nr:GNAT family N-acetyltransferase [Hyphomicrobiaceae bacterium]
MSIDIVPIGEEHIEGFHAALDVVARERAYLAFLEAPPIEKTREFVSRNIAKGYPQVVALDGDRVVGWCDVLPMDRPVWRHCGVLGVGLLPEYRGRGVGRRLMQSGLQAARDFGLSRVELSVRADNARAIALYARLGFVAEGRRRRAVLVDGAYYDVLTMALLFDAEP